MLECALGVGGSGGWGGGWGGGEGISSISFIRAELHDKVQGVNNACAQRRATSRDSG